MTQDWPSRITRLGKERVNQLLAHPNNARRHPARQRDALRASMNTLGIVSPVVVNERTGYVLDGHARIEEFLSRDEHAEIDVLYVDLSEQEEAQFLATFDYITYLAEFDKDILAGLLEEIDISAPGMDALVEDISINVLDEDKEGEDPNYSRKIDIPIYEPHNERPQIAELFDDTRTRQLLAEIDAATVTEEEKAFLRIAAQRHTVLNFAKIADLYAHGSVDLQRLMEDSALVIIDFDRAIELGYVKLTEKLTEMVGEWQKDA